jgi:hypothetical protein
MRSESFVKDKGANVKIKLFNLLTKLALNSDVYTLKVGDWAKFALPI